MTYLYYEENEHKNSNIKYNNTNNQIDNISSNLLLKRSLHIIPHLLQFFLNHHHKVLQERYTL